MWQRGHINGNKVAYAKDRSQKIIESFGYHTGKSGIAYQAEQEEVKKHVERIQPKIFPDFFLIFAPRKSQLQQIHGDGNSDEPIEVTTPMGTENLVGQVMRVARKVVDEYFVIFFHALLSDEL